MLNYRVIALIKRELHEKLLSKAFILMTVLLPVLMFGIFGVQTFIMSFDSEKSVVEIVAASDVIAESLQSVIGESSFIKDSTIIPIISSMNKMEFDNFVKSKESDLLNETITGIIFIPESALIDKKIQYYSKTPKNRRLLERIDNPINQVLIEKHFQSKNIPTEELKYARLSVDIASFKVSEGEEIKEEGYGNLILAYLFSFLLYISLLMMGSMVMQTVIQEKSNRIVEVLLSSVTSKELMIGKILGAAITGLLQMAIWISPIILVTSTSWFMLPENLTIDITFLQVAYLLVNFFLGLLIFVGLFATVGSIFEDPQDAQSGMWPVMLLIMIPFFISISMIENPSNPVASIASMSPFAAVIVMPAKMAMVDVPLWQILVSTAVNVLTVIGIFPIAGKIYRVGIMMTGKKPSWVEVIKWLKYKY